MGTTLEIKSAVEAADAVRKMLHAFVYEPKLFGTNSTTLEDFDGYEAVVSWEEGPHEWPFDDSTKATISNVLSGSDYNFEVKNHFSIGIYRDNYPTPSDE